MSLEALAGQSLFTVIDLETTGLDATVDSIVEMAAVRLEDGQVTARWQTLVDPGPGVVIPPSSQAVHGIDAAMLEGAPSLATALEALCAFMGEAPVVAHNAPFDLGFLQQAALRTGLTVPTVPVIDTLELARELFPEHRSHKLEAVCKALGHDAERFHRAADDAGHLAAIFPRLWPMWLARRAWHRGQFTHIDQVARRFEAVTRVLDALQQEVGELKRTLTLYLEEHPDASIPLGDGTVLSRSVREAWEYDAELLLPLLEAWGLKQRLVKLDRQRLERWLAADRFTSEQREAVLNTRVASPAQPRLLRHVAGEAAPRREART